jgi:hypothetical protein
MMILVTMFTIYILMHIISFKLQPSMKVNIHNQCSDFKLTDRGYFSSGTSLNGYPAQEVDAGSMISFGFQPSPLVFEGVLTYELQRKHVESDNQLESTYIRLFVVWKSKGYKKLCAYINLVEYDEKFYWNNTKSQEYYRGYASQLSTYTDPIKDTWLVYDDTVLMTRLELDFTQRDDILNITISKSVKDEHTRKPERIDSER